MKYVEEQNGPPVIFISFSTIPNKFDKNEYIKQLQSALVANGFSKSLQVKPYGELDKIKAWWDNSPSTTISISSYQDGFPLDAGGFAKLNDPNSVIIYAGLSALSLGTVQPIEYYINATLHEIGHGFFGFMHSKDGTATGISGSAPSVMDYKYAYEIGRGFNSLEKQVVKNSIWGNH